MSADDGPAPSAPSADDRRASSGAARPSGRAKLRSPLPRFGFRSLLVFAVCFCLFFAWIGRNVHRSRQEDAAVETLMQAGAALTLHGREPLGSTQEEDERLNELMDRAKSIAFFDRAVGLSDRPLISGISLDHRTAPKPTIRAAIEALPHLPEIERVALWGTFFDDATCDALVRLPNLQELTLDGTNVSERGLARLESLPELRTLTLRDPTASQALGGVPRLKRLRTLTLFNMYTSQSAIAGIAKLPELESLDLIGAPPKDDVTFHALSGATKLRSLSVIGSGFSDSDLPALAGLRELESLDVRVEDEAGLIHLAGLPKLRRLELSGRISPDAVRRFSADHPEVAIGYRSPDGTTHVRFLNGVSDEDAAADDGEEIGP